MCVYRHIHGRCTEPHYFYVRTQWSLPRHPQLNWHSALDYDVKNNPVHDRQISPIDINPLINSIIDRYLSNLKIPDRNKSNVQYFIICDIKLILVILHLFIYNSNFFW
ncbi:unnamed protein product [Meganyctiphanes norvegica]|uniref:Uncharacterized protein n=1 Tax=Meganyctiphanes norvegica TaxID=48144 RepID=A0AAV2SX93_MEGNR